MPPTRRPEPKERRSEGASIGQSRLHTTIAARSGSTGNAILRSQVLTERRQFVDSLTLYPWDTFVRFDVESEPPVTDGLFAETKDLIASWMLLDGESTDRAHEVAALLSSAAGPGGRPLQEWLERRPFRSEFGNTPGFPSHRPLGAVGQQPIEDETATGKH